MQSLILWPLRLRPGLPPRGAEGRPTACCGTGAYSASLAAAGCHVHAQPLARKAGWDLCAKWGGAGTSVAGNHSLRLEPRPQKSAVGCAQVAPSPVPRIGVNAGRAWDFGGTASAAATQTMSCPGWTYIKPSTCCPSWIFTDQHLEKPQEQPKQGINPSVVKDKGPLPEL